MRVQVNRIYFVLLLSNNNVNNTENVANNKYIFHRENKKNRFFVCERKILFLHLLSLKIEHF